MRQVGETPLWGKLYAEKRSIYRDRLWTNKPKLRKRGAISTGGVVLNEVQYSTLSLRGTGTHSGDTWAHGVQPWNNLAYNGWGIILRGNCNSNTIVQTHCEGSGGCVLIQGPGSFENVWTTAVMSMMQVRERASSFFSFFFLPCEFSNFPGDNFDDLPRQARDKRKDDNANQGASGRFT